jgi:Flp pilus assembly protein TadG
VGFIGLATDSARGYMVQARISDALDAAALAAAHEVGTADFQPTLEMYFNANFPPGFLGATPTLGTPQVSEDEMVVTLSASAQIDTVFMHLFGHDNMQVATATEVTREEISMDVVIAMDMSGSMNSSDGNGSTRIAAARAAADTLVSILFGPDATKEHLTMGLVPWGGKVNITVDGTTFTGVTAVPQVFTHPISGNPMTELQSPNNSPVPLLDVPPADWRGCVYARYTDDGNSTNDADHLLSAGSFGGADWLGWEHVGDEGETCSGCTPCPVNGITRLTNTKATISDAITGLANPLSGTYTNAAQGMAWAWRVLSPGEPFDDAEANPVGLHKRAIILLTDGQQTGRQGDAYKKEFGGGSGAGPNGMDDRLRAVTQNAKDEGITIYAIQFYYNSGPLRALMEEIATAPYPPYYIYAPTGAELNDAFQEIANDLTGLRISK